jgi:hypothetical protein
MDIVLIALPIATLVMDQGMTNVINATLVSQSQTANVSLVILLVILVKELPQAIV